MIATLDGAASTPPTSEEVERARADLLRQIDLSTNDSEALGMALSEFTARGDWRLMFIGRDRIRTATVDDVRRVATSTETGQRTVGVFTPIAEPVRAEIPAAPDIAALVKDHKGDATATAGEAFDPSPSNIDARRRAATSAGDQARPAEEDPRRHRGRAVPLNYGDENSLKNRVVAGELVPAMLSRGSAKRDAPADRRRDEPHQGERRRRRNCDRHDRLDPDRARQPAGCAPPGGRAPRPGFPEAEFEQLRQERIAGAELARASRPPSRR